MGMYESGEEGEAWHKHLALMSSHWCSLHHLADLNCTANTRGFILLFYKHIRLKIEDFRIEGPVQLKRNMLQQQCGKFKSPWDLLTLECLPPVWVRTSYSRNHSYPNTRFFTVLQAVKAYSLFPPKSLRDSTSPLRLQKNISSESVIVG